MTIVFALDTAFCSVLFCSVPFRYVLFCSVLFVSVRLTQGSKMGDMLDDYEREYKDLVETVNKRCTKIPDLKGGVFTPSTLLLHLELWMDSVWVCVCVCVCFPRTRFFFPVVVFKVHRVNARSLMCRFASPRGHQ